jgi:hypothetical protein
MAKNNKDQVPQQPPTPEPALKRLDVLVGKWNVKGHTSNPNDVITGQATFEWLPGGFFLIQRFEFNFIGQEIKGLEVIGYDKSSKAFSASVYSNMGEFAVPYKWDVQDDIVTHWTEGSHFKGKLSDNGNTLTGAWEPEKGKESPENVAYEATMTRVKRE